MFPREVIVEIKTADEGIITFLADEALVSGDPLRVKATRLGVEKENVSICLLPTEDTDSGSRWVRVKEQDLLVA